MKKRKDGYFTEIEEAIMQEAFMIGRIYEKTGEKEKLSEIQEKLKSKCARIIYDIEKSKTLAKKREVMK